MSASNLADATEGLIGALGLNREDHEIVDDYGMVGLHAVRRTRSALIEARKEAAAAPKLYEVLAEWDEPGACGCDTIMCRGTCLPAKTQAALAAARGEEE